LDFPAFHSDVVGGDETAVHFRDAVRPQSTSRWRIQLDKNQFHLITLIGIHSINFTNYYPLRFTLLRNWTVSDNAH
jgi:hypothetical protein